MASLKEILEGKCTDPSQWMDYAYFLNSRYANWSQLGYSTVENPEWWIREALRENQGVYPKPTTVLTHIRNMYPDTFLHISREDPKMVAYTPDASSGVADRQVKTTLGRYLAKYHTRMPESIAKQVVHDHLAEADPTIEYLQGEDLVSVYRGGNFSTCMSGSSKSWEYLPKGWHPAEVYMMDNIKMAVMRDADGKVTERALVVTRPDGTQGYIRVYGTKLAKKMQRNGIQSTTWHGIKFNTKVFDSDRNQITGPLEIGETYNVTVPYLDGAGAAGGTEKSAVALIDGVLQGVTLDELRVLQNEYGSDSVIVATNTSGYVHIRNVPHTALYAVCPISGESFKKSDIYAWKWYLNEAGVAIRVSKNADVGDLKAYAMANNSVISCIAHPSIARFEHRYSMYHDTPEMRDYCDLVQLDAAKYPDRVGTWVPRADTCVITEGADEQRVLNVDTVSLISVVEGSVVEQQVWKPTRKFLKELTKLYPRHRGDKVYADKSMKVLTTLSGKLVLRGFHDIMSVAGNHETVEFSKKVTTARFMGKTVYLPKGSAMTIAQKNYIVASYLDDNMDAYCDTNVSSISELVDAVLDAGIGEERLKRAIYSLINRLGTYEYHGRYTNIYDHTAVDIPAIVEGRYFSDYPVVKEWYAKWSQLLDMAEIRLRELQETQRVAEPEQLPAIAEEVAVDAEEAAELPAPPARVDIRNVVTTPAVATALGSTVVNVSTTASIVTAATTSFIVAA